MKASLKGSLYPLALKFAPALLFKLQHFRMHKRYGSHWYWANLRKPRTFNEKLLVTKLNQQHKGFSLYADKAAVKQWASDIVGPQYIIPTIGIYTTVEEISIDELPKPCILKPTHLSGETRVLRSCQALTDPDGIEKELQAWLDTNHYWACGEPQYRSIRPQIICEPLIGDHLDDLRDYKIFCFEGRPQFIQVDINRHNNHSRAVLDTNWKNLNFTMRYPMAKTSPEPPPNLDRMLDIARKLSKPFPFVRVDLYSFDNHIYFGELTFHPGSGNEPFSTYESDLNTGKAMPDPHPQTNLRSSQSPE